MTKFEIKTNTFEFSFGKSKNSIPSFTADEIFDAFIDQDDGNHEETRETFDSKEDALKCFSANYADWGKTRAVKGSVFWLLCGEVAWLEEVDYDDDGELLFSNGVWAQSAEAFSA